MVNYSIRIRILKEIYGTITKTAKKLKVSRSSVSRWIRNKTPNRINKKLINRRFYYYSKKYLVQSRLIFKTVGFSTMFGFFGGPALQAKDFESEWEDQIKDEFDEIINRYKTEQFEKNPKIQFGVVKL